MPTPSLWKSPGVLLHGGDYNPEQWSPSVWREDIRLMKEARINVVALGIFAWSHLEVADGEYDFAWMDDVVDLLDEAGIRIMMATPSGARPPWLAQQYPEVLRVNDQRMRQQYGFRHNHCPTSPIYRRKVASINGLLAKRYGPREHVILWHVSNEYNAFGCHCPLCQKAFQDWLRRRYQSLDQLNAAWWSSFWSHRYTEWGQIESPGPNGENRLHGLVLDWKRFCSDQAIDFMQAEIAALRQFDPNTPVTTNLMGDHESLDYFRLCQHLDIVSWDSYPDWHCSPDSEETIALETAFLHDLNRSMGKGKPFLLMESTPSVVNWRRVNKPKKPGMHQLASLQALAHGSDSVQYFQWRQSRGSSEKFHGSVVGVSDPLHSRAFREVCDLGKSLGEMPQITDSTIAPQAAIFYDWENRWAYEQCQGFHADKKAYREEVFTYYRPFWLSSIPVDVVNQDSDLKRYRFLVAPLLYMVRPGLAERLRAFVQSGGTLVVTHTSGQVNETDLLFEGGPPGPLTDLLGLRVLETDVLHDHEKAILQPTKDAGLPNADYQAHDICEVLHLEGAEALAHYSNQYYAGSPCLTQHTYGKGKAYYVACRANADFVCDFLQQVLIAAEVPRVWPNPLPAGVNVQVRTKGSQHFFFLMNFTHQPQTLSSLPENLHDLRTGQPFLDSLVLDPLEGRVLQTDCL